MKNIKITLLIIGSIITTQLFSISDYDLLGVKSNATKDEINKAYRAKALKVHPDRCPESEKKECQKKFIELTDAKERLLAKLEAPKTAPKIETTFPASKPLGTSIWDFEFKNKEKYPVYITVKNNGRTILNNYKVNAATGSSEKNMGYVRTTGLVLNQPTTIFISPVNNLLVDVSNYETSGKNNETIYVSWENQILRPQTGKGIFDKTTQSGLTLKNNVKTLKKISK